METKTTLQELKDTCHSVGALKELQLLLVFITRAGIDLASQEQLVEYVENRSKELAV